MGIDVHWVFIEELKLHWHYNNYRFLVLPSQNLLLSSKCMMFGHPPMGLEIQIIESWPFTWVECEGLEFVTLVDFINGHNNLKTATHGIKARFSFISLHFERKMAIKCAIYNGELRAFKNCDGQNIKWSCPTWFWRAIVMTMIGIMMRWGKKWRCCNLWYLPLIILDVFQL